jgi:hypothetical protein
MLAQTPLKISNITSNSFDVSNTVLQLDNNNFPHISWLESKNGYFNALNKYLSKTDWETIGNTLIVSTSYNSAIDKIYGDCTIA